MASSQLVHWLLVVLSVTILRDGGEAFGPVRDDPSDHVVSQDEGSGDQTSSFLATDSLPSSENDSMLAASRGSDNNSVPSAALGRHNESLLASVLGSDNGVLLAASGNEDNSVLAAAALESDRNAVIDMSDFASLELNKMENTTAEYSTPLTEYSTPLTEYNTLPEDYVTLPVEYTPSPGIFSSMQAEYSSKPEANAMPPSAVYSTPSAEYYTPTVDSRPTQESAAGTVHSRPIAGGDDPTEIDASDSATDIGLTESDLAGVTAYSVLDLGGMDVNSSGRSPDDKTPTVAGSRPPPELTEPESRSPARASSDLPAGESADASSPADSTELPAAAALTSSGFGKEVLR
jgi:hypothetical protein